MALPFFAALAGLTAFFWPKKAVSSVPRRTSSAIYGPQQAYSVVPRVDARDLDTLARTLWGEARGEGSTGMQGVANVIMNRYKQRPRYGATVHEICIRPYQFSAWLANDPNRAQMLRVTTADPAFAEAVRIARLALEYRLPDITGGADHYHTHAVRPAWSNGKTPIMVVGAHKFFNLTGGYA